MPSSSDLHKVPSVLTYNSKGEVTSWGYRLDSHRHQISWFKLGLSEYGSQKLAQEQPERSEMLKVLAAAFRKKPAEVVGDYLRCLWTHATESIQTNIGRHLWENLQLKIVLTVPAIWDHKAQELTRKAAEMAGLLARTNTTLELIGEPEAAALAVFDEMTAQKKRSLQVSST
jgi:molecular chaperone DnaK (HSP70)